MTATERLRAAIDKLEQQLAATYPVRHDSEWVVTHEATETERHIFVLDSHNDGYDGSVVADCWSTAGAELIVTLHRTIDAQLSLLRRAEKFLGTLGHHTSNIASPFVDDALALAHAINGKPAITEGADR